MSNHATRDSPFEVPRDENVDGFYIASEIGSDSNSKRSARKRGPTSTSIPDQGGQAFKKHRKLSSPNHGLHDETKSLNKDHQSHSPVPSMGENRRKAGTVDSKTREKRIRWDPRALVVSDKEVICRICEPKIGRRTYNMHQPNHAYYLIAWLVHCGTKMHQQWEDEAVRRGELPPKKYLPARFRTDCKYIPSLRAAQTGDDRNPEHYPDPLPCLDTICPTLPEQVPADSAPALTPMAQQPQNRPAPIIVAPIPSYSPLYYQRMLAELVKSCDSPQTLPTTGVSASEITPSTSLDHKQSRVTVQDATVRSSPSAQEGEGLVNGVPPPTRAAAPHHVDTFINPTGHPAMALDFVHYLPVSPAAALGYVENPKNGPNRPLSPKASTTNNLDEGVWLGSGPWVRRQFSAAKGLQRTGSMSSIASTATTGTVNTVATASTAATIVGELWGFPLHLSKL